MTPDLKFYGRRKGRPLRARQSTLVAAHLNQFLLSLPPEDQRIAPHTLFDVPYTQMGLEIGFGGGEHLAATAKDNPHMGIIGIEAFENGVAALLEQVITHRLTNVRLYNDDARPFVARLAPGSFHRIDVLFPDPWPKKRHHKRRLLQVDFIQHLVQLLVPGGTLRMATDHETYGPFIYEALTEVQGINPLSPMGTYHARPQGMPPTRYETKALNDGRHPFYFHVTRQG